MVPSDAIPGTAAKRIGEIAEPATTGIAVRGLTFGWGAHAEPMVRDLTYAELAERTNRIDDGFSPGDGIHVGVAVSLRGGGLVALALKDADQL
ncbi:hypothetical protein [Amycolatopsis anabasis]|uniref:hypothetical protein n=1 Tax=Amycolatopsis anabasis TaxID=1840409 RepID=UPI00131BFADD|nr:hypothetical protein [Amycolatopsis anabasis]